MNLVISLSLNTSDEGHVEVSHFIMDNVSCNVIHIET